MSDGERLIHYIKSIREFRHEPDKALIYEEKALKEAKALLDLVERLKMPKLDRNKIFLIKQNQKMQSKIKSLETILEKAETLGHKKWETGDDLVYVSLYDYGDLQQAIADYKKGE